MSLSAGKYDEALTSILVNEKSILGFLSSIFNFLARRTDFYYVPQGPHENMGFPPGVAEELVVKILRSCDPKNWKPPNGTPKHIDVNNEIMCSTVAQEVEVVTEEMQDSVDDCVQDKATTEEQPEDLETVSIDKELPECNIPPASSSSTNNEDNADSSGNETPPIIPTQKNSETYNGAEREKYSWSQTIMELDVTVKLPPGIKSAKNMKVTINPGDLCVACNNGEVLIKDSFPYKIKTMESFWSISGGKLLIHLEKVQERWWNKLLVHEEEIDLSKIDCSRDLYDLPDDHIQKVREIQWNQEQKLKGLPTSDQLRNIEILKKAWNAEGSPFKGKEFDPTVLHNQINM